MDSHILCMDEPGVVKATCGLRDFLVCFVLELKTQDITKGVITLLQSWRLPNIYTTSILREACMASAALEMERFVVFRPKGAHLPAFQTFPPYHYIKAAGIGCKVEVRLCFKNIDARALLRLLRHSRLCWQELISWSHLQLKPPREVWKTSFQIDFTRRSRFY